MKPHPGQMDLLGGPVDRRRPPLTGLMGTAQAELEGMIDAWLRETRPGGEIHAAQAQMVLIGMSGRSRKTYWKDKLIARLAELRAVYAPETLEDAILARADIYREIGEIGAKMFNVTFYAELEKGAASQGAHATAKAAGRQAELEAMLRRGIQPGPDQ